MSARRQAQLSPQMRAPDVLKSPSSWAGPVVLVCLLVFVMTLVYFGSVVNPSGHLHGLPVAVVNEDLGASAGSGRLNFGEQVAAGLTGSRVVSSRLSLHPVSLAVAEHRMDLGKQYAAVVIGPGFTSSLLAIAGVRTPAGQAATKPAIELLTNPRAGTLGVSLASGVVSPALERASRELGQRLAQLGSAEGASAAVTALLKDPVTVSTVVYRPLPSHTGLGLSAFYIALLTTFCGFLGAVIVHTSVDAALGYAATEIGPVWRQRLPVAISRWQTLVAKWVIAVVLTVVLTGVMLAAAVGILQMNTPHFWLLWLLTWFAATVVALGTLVLFAALGTLGQLVALLVFVYLALASSGGTVPLEALSGFFRFVANFEPLRQILDGVRAILYFDAAGGAGLTRAWVATAAGLVFWVVLGVLVTAWYDRSNLYRMPPDLMEHLHRAVGAYQQEREGNAPDNGLEGRAGPAIATPATGNEPPSPQ